jgi:hypothetical protein
MLWDNIVRCQLSCAVHACICFICVYSIGIIIIDPFAWSGVGLKRKLSFSYFRENFAKNFVFEKFFAKLFFIWNADLDSGSTWMCIQNRNTGWKFLQKRKLSEKTITGTKIFRENEHFRKNFRKNENFGESFRETKFREKWANFRFSRKLKKGFSFQP